MGEKELRFGEDRRKKTERRVSNDPKYNKQECRRIADRRNGNDRRIK